MGGSALGGQEPEETTAKNYQPSCSEKPSIREAVPGPTQVGHIKPLPAKKRRQWGRVTGKREIRVNRQV